MAALKRLTLAQFKQGCVNAALKSAKFDLACAIPKGYATEIRKAAEGGERAREFLASTPDVDRDGDTVAVEGFELDNFRKSGSFLWCHQYNVSPIAKPLAVFAQDGALHLRVDFPEKDFPHEFGAGFGHGVMRMYDEGLLRGVSVGFIPKEWAYNEERGGWAPTDFKRQELLEVSATPVPANPNALVIGRTKGIDIAPLCAGIETIRDKDTGLWVPKETLTALLDAATTSVSSSSAKPTKTADEAEATAEAKASSANPAATDDGDAYSVAAAALEKAEGAVVDRVVAGIEAIAKRGRVLSAANENRLRDARDLLSDVISQVEESDDDEAEGAEAEGDDPEERGVTAEQFASMTKEAIDTSMKAILGRLPD